MVRPRRSTLPLALVFGVVGCSQPIKRPTPVGFDDRIRPAVHQPETRPTWGTAVGPMPASPEFSGPQSLDVYIRRALNENRTVRAAYHNVQAMRHRIPQVTALEDPMASNTIYPIPSVAPQYSLMGYNPYVLMLTQQFPWFGTLRLRGEAAERDVQVALAELATAQLDTVAAVKRAYADLHAARKTEDILLADRKTLEEIREAERERVKAGVSQQDSIRAEIRIGRLDQELVMTRQALVTARASLARQLHVSPESDLRTTSELPIGTVPAEFDRLYQLAIMARPELRGRLAAVARDTTAVALARKRTRPNVTLGLSYMDMQKTNAETPQTAGGMPNVGLVVGFNLPVYRAKNRAGIFEAQEKVRADAQLYEAGQDEATGEIRDFMAQAKAQWDILALLRESILPRAEEALDLARDEYARGLADFPGVSSALSETLQIRLQMVRAEADLAKALASLERAVGCELNDHPPQPGARPDANPPPMLPPIPSAPGSGAVLPSGASVPARSLPKH